MVFRIVSRPLTQAVLTDCSLRRLTHVNSSLHQPWLRAALLFGALYLVVVRLFAAPATYVQEWRLAAWMVCGVAFAAHIAYEHFRLRHSPLLVASHAALAVALGALLLALAGMINSLWTRSALRPIWLLALVLWPAFTAIPAFLVALVVATLLKHLRLRTDRVNL